MMWLIKLPFRILAIPVFLVAFLILIVIKLLSYLGNLAGGLVILIVAGGIIFYIYKMQWTNLFLSVLVAVMVLAAMFCATIIEMTMERICTAIGDFIRY